MRILGSILVTLPHTLFLSYLFFLGATVGSFLNVVIARLPAGESVVRPRSKCPKCGDMIPWWLNIPLLSWLFLRGRCRACKTKISIRYPMVELLTAVLFTACGAQYGQTMATASGVIICGMLVAITFIDIDIWEIPDEISLPGIVIGCLLRPVAFDVPWFDGILGAAMGAGFLWLIRWGFFVVRGIEGMGMGDVKLIATIGAFVGPFGLVPTILISSISGTIIGTIVLLVNRDSEEVEASNERSAEQVNVAPESTSTASNKDQEDGEEEWVPPKNAVPFGPFLSLGAICTVLFSETLQLYLLRIIL